MSPSSHTAAARTAPAPLRQRWQALAPREQNLLRAGAALVAAALLWWLALAPALHTLRTAPARHAQLDAQLQHMLALQHEARQLQGTPRAAPDNAARALQSAVAERLGAGARLALAEGRATVTLQGTPADALAPWLAQVRSNAKVVPQEVHLVRSSSSSSAAPAPAPAPAFVPTAAALGLSAVPAASAGAGALAAGGAPAPARWDGTLVLALPPR